MNQLLTQDDLVLLLGVTRASVRKLIQRGLPHVKVLGRFRFEEEKVLAWLKCQEKANKPGASGGKVMP